ncbi:phage integrase SAM-like domain-containing protein [Limnohabitans sp. DCL3]|uniref:phage integrase SAM-like domain-containing protein n=1 Tax=Limnohabitans sp. DCL3 TaxID=3374103 RepID=UPI003A85710C
MTVRPLLASLCTSLDDFLATPMDTVAGSGASAVAILHANRPVFYVVSPEVWQRMAHSVSPPGEAHGSLAQPAQPEHAFLPDAAPRASDLHARVLPPAPTHAARSPRRSAEGVSDSVLTTGAMRLNRFDALADQLIGQETLRVQRGELSAASVGILKNRLDAHVLPYFKYIPPSQVTPVMMDGFVQRLTDCHLSSTTVSQYLVVVRKLLKLAIRHGFLRELPEMPPIKITSKPRSSLSVTEYLAVVRTAHRLAKRGDVAPEIKASTSQRERFWVQPRHLTLPPDMAWAIRFMVNSFVRPGDLRQLQHKHIQIVRGTHVYLRMTLPETKGHDAPMVTLTPAVQVYAAAWAHAQKQGWGGPDDYLFLPAEKDRNYALAVLGFWFKWVMREAGVAPTDHTGRLRTLYCLRHTAIMFRLLYGQGIDMLTLARNARTSVQMIERFYASALDGEMNVAMLQSRRTSKP